MTQIYFLLDTEEETHITDISYDGYPRFNIGERIFLEVKNHDPKKWDVSDLRLTEYEIMRIEHSASKYYGSNVNCSTLQYVYLKVVAP